MAKKINVLFAAFEASPFIKTGGLGDVAGSLPAALKGKDCEIRVPLSDRLSRYHLRLTALKVNPAFLPYIYLYQMCIRDRMCCIQNQFRSFCCKKLLHLFFVKAFCTNR